MKNAVLSQAGCAGRARRVLGEDSCVTLHGDWGTPKVNCLLLPKNHVYSLEKWWQGGRKKGIILVGNKEQNLYTCCCQRHGRRMFESLSEVQTHLHGSFPVVEWGSPVSFFMFVFFFPSGITLKCSEIFSVFGFILAFFVVCSLYLGEWDLLLWPFNELGLPLWLLCVVEKAAERLKILKGDPCFQIFKRLCI